MQISNIYNIMEKNEIKQGTLNEIGVQNINETNTQNNNEMNSQEDNEMDSQLAENEFIDNIPEDPSNTYEAKRELLAKTKIVKQTWSILEIYQKIKSEKLNLSPDYQRNNIWKIDKQTAFIESLFMGILIPPIYVVEIPGTDMLEESSYEVVDGKQRLTTITKFLKNEIALNEKALEYYTDWFKGKKYIDLSSEYKSLVNEMLSSVLDIYVITANSPEFTKYDIFSRLNKGAEKLKVNEIRKAIYRSKTLTYIDEFVKDYLDLTKNDKEKYNRYNRIFSKAAQKRYDDYGRFYRSIAFFLKSDLNEKIVKDYNSRPREMINNVLYKIQKGELDISKNDLNVILESTLELKEKITNIDGIDYVIDACIPFVTNKNKILFNKINDIITDETIKNSLKKSPATTSNVNLRLETICNIIQQNG